MKTIKRKEIKDKLFVDMLKKEHHHKHKIVEINGVYRWKKNIDVCNIMEKISLNDLIPLFEILGYSRNSEIYRKLYRDIGYSLSGYWEVFYWEMNNENCKYYKIKKTLKKEAETEHEKYLMNVDNIINKVMLKVSNAEAQIELVKMLGDLKK